MHPGVGPCHRIVVVGTSGAGKSTLARRISATLDLPYVELDALFHGPAWTCRVEFEADVAAFAARGHWVTEYQYSGVRPLLLDRADLMVWLDLPRGRQLLRVVRRTVGRRRRREELWNGNVEASLWRLFTDRDHIIRWAWRTRGQAAELVGAARATRPDLPVVRLRSQRQVDGWVTDLDQPVR